VSRKSNRLAATWITAKGDYIGKFVERVRFSELRLKRFILEGLVQFQPSKGSGKLPNGTAFVVVDCRTLGASGAQLQPGESEVVRVECAQNRNR